MRPATLLDILTDGVMTITPELASRILDEANYEDQGNRHKSPAARSHIRGFAQMIRSGEFRGESNCIYICVVEGRAYLVDGYHRMEGIVESAMPTKVRVVILPRDSMKEVALDYSIYNRGTRPRTAAQVRGAFEVFAQDSAVSKGLQAALHKSVPFILTGFSNAGMKFLPPEMKTDAFIFTQSGDWVEACELYQRAMDKRTYRAINKKFLNPSIVGMAVVILRYQPELGMEFWSRVFDFGSLPNEDARRVLNESLNSRTDESARTPKGLACMVEAAWKKWLASEPVTVLRVSSQAMERPMAVTRTPYKPAVA
jgi:hypothetical protein